MKKVGIAAIAVLIIALIGETLFLFQQFSVQQQAARQQTELQHKITDLEKDKIGLEGNKSDLQSDLERLAQEKEKLADQVVKLDGDGKALQDQVAKLKKTTEEKTTAVNKYLAEIASLKNNLYCKNALSNVDFSNNSKVSEKLASYVMSTKTRDDPVTAHYWKVIWTDSKYSVHTVEVNVPKENMTYIWTFTVYFDGEAHGRHVNGIFYNDGQCWLYLDK